MPPQIRKFLIPRTDRWWFRNGIRVRFLSKVKGENHDEIYQVILAVILLAGCSKKNDESNLTVLTGGGEVSYTVEEAKTVPELEKGLMFRESLAPNAGMIFDLSKVEHTAMWMKNTKIPLDMIFIDGDGVISWIYENAQPESLTLIIPPFPAAAVLEINAGDVKKHGIKTGDKIEHEFFAEHETGDTSEPRAADETAAEVSDAPADEAPADRPEDAMTE